MPYNSDIGGETSITLTPKNKNVYFSVHPVLDNYSFSDCFAFAGTTYRNAETTNQENEEGGNVTNENCKNAGDHSVPGSEGPGLGAARNRRWRARQRGLEPPPATCYDCGRVAYGVHAGDDPPRCSRCWLETPGGRAEERSRVARSRARKRMTVHEPPPETVPNQ